MTNEDYTKVLTRLIEYHAQLFANESRREVAVKPTTAQIEIEEYISLISRLKITPRDERPIRKKVYVKEMGVDGRVFMEVLYPLPDLGLVDASIKSSEIFMRYAKSIKHHYESETGLRLNLSRI